MIQDQYLELISNLAELSMVILTGLLIVLIVRFIKNPPTNSVIDLAGVFFVVLITAYIISVPRGLKKLEDDTNA